MVWGGRTTFSLMLFIDFVIFVILSTAALIHEASASLLPPVLLLFFLYTKKIHRVMHFLFVLNLLAMLYVILMKCYTFSNSDIIAESWSGIYSNPDSFRYNDGLLSGTDKVRALFGVEAARGHLASFDLASVTHLLIAVVVPFFILLFSGITVFYSASAKAKLIRILLILLSFCPIGLCLVANDFGRWYSMCAINCLLYSLLIAHSVDRIELNDSSYENDRKIKNVIKQCTVVLITIILLNYKLDCWGNLIRTSQPLDYAKQILVDSSNLYRDIQPIIYRTKVIQPVSNFDSLPWVINEITIDKNMQNAVCGNSEMGRMPFVITGEEASEFFRIPFGDNNLSAGIKISKSDKGAKNYNKKVINTGDIMVGTLKSSSNNSRR